MNYGARTVYHALESSWREKKALKTKAKVWFYGKICVCANVFKESEKEWALRLWSRIIFIFFRNFDRKMVSIVLVADKKNHSYDNSHWNYHIHDNSWNTYSVGVDLKTLRKLPWIYLVRKRWKSSVFFFYYFFIRSLLLLSYVN